MNFRIECIVPQNSVVALIVKQLDDGPWSLSATPHLAGIPIQRMVDQPRALKPDGTPDLTLFVFFTIGSRHAATFQVGQIVDLTG